MEKVSNFWGTFQSALGLKKLLESDFFDIRALITQKDKAAGRKLKITKPATKILAEEKNISIFQPEKIKEVLKDIKEINPDLIVVIAYGKILPPEILNIPKYGCINVHASLLPKHRGASCIPATILAGDKKGGITIMKMDEGMDTGPIIKKIEYELKPQENSSTLMEEIMQITQENLETVLKKYIRGELKEEKQNHDQASYSQMIKKEDGHLNLQKDKALEVEKKIRAYHPWPRTYGYMSLPKKKILIKILEVDNNFLEAKDIKSGEFFLHNKNLAIKAQDQALIIKKLQLEGKKEIEATEFIRGNSWIIGKKLE